MQGLGLQHYPFPSPSPTYCCGSAAVDYDAVSLEYVTFLTIFIDPLSFIVLRYTPYIPFL